MAEEMIGLTPDGKREVWRDTTTGALSYKTPDEQGRRSAAETPFERAVAQARESVGNLDDPAGVSILLNSAGVDPAKVSEISANPSMVALIKAKPDLAYHFARVFPADYAINYQEQRAQMGFGLPIEEVFTSGGPDAMARNLLEKSVQTSPTGAQLHPGGVLVDLENLRVIYPPTDPSIAGSAAWMARIPEWSEEKQKTWTKTLHKMGYLATKNPNLKDLTDALKTYHDTRYLYGAGKPVDLSTGDGGITRKDFGGMLDEAVLASEIEPWYEDLYGDKPEPEELKYWTEKFKTTAVRVARRRGLDPADAAMVAQARTQRRFSDTPEAREFEQQADEREENTRLRDSLLSVAQIVGGM
jgi:hypothetical protein